MEDIDLLSWLPAKTICKFKTVSNAWNALLSEEFFVNKQCSNMKYVPEDHGFFIQRCSYQKRTHALEDHTYKDSGLGLPRHAVDSLSKTSRILGSSNGLVCCRKKSTLYLCNLINQTCCPIRVPVDLSGSDRLTGVKVLLGASNYELLDDYTLTLFMVHIDDEWDSDYRLLCMVYSAKEESWKDGGIVTLGGRYLPDNLMPVYLDGIVYFLTDSYLPHSEKGCPFYWPYIVAYDIKTGTSSSSPIPKGARRYVFDRRSKMGIFRYDSKSICLVQVKKLVCYVWKLIDYGSNQWKRILKKRVRAMGIRGSVAGFTITDGWLVLATRNRVYRYDLASNQCTGKAEVVCSHRCGREVSFQFYTSTFRRCGKCEMSMYDVFQLGTVNPPAVDKDPRDSKPGCGRQHIRKSNGTNHHPQSTSFSQ